MLRRAYLAPPKQIIMGGGVSQPGQDVSLMAAPPGEAIGVAKVNCCFSFLFVISHFPSSPEKPSGVDCFFLIFLQDFFYIDDAVGLMVRSQQCAGKFFSLLSAGRRIQG